MPRPRVFTPTVIPQIRCWVGEGLTAEEIAKQLGCTIGTLRVRCSQLGISLRRQRNQGSPTARRSKPKNTMAAQCECLELSLPSETAEAMRREAGLRGISMSALAAGLLELIVNDALYDAVLGLLT